jgi:hypothetical protein
LVVALSWPFYCEEHDAILRPLRAVRLLLTNTFEYRFFTAADCHCGLPEAERAERRIRARDNSFKYRIVPH